MNRVSSRLLLAAACVLAQPAWAAAPQEAADPVVALLQKAQAAARENDYSGVFTYQQGSVMQSTRVVHVIDGTGERELLEMLDGAPREFLRHNDTVQCLIPEKKLIILERRRGDRFPGLLLGDGKNIPAHYETRQSAARNRVAGRECKMLELIPKDSARYGYRFCIDAASSLLLKAQTLGRHRDVVDQISFTSLQVGTGIAADQLNPRWKTQDWRVVDAPMQTIDLSKLGWRIPAPSGFESVTQVSRPMKAGKQVSQLVLSDGLAAISVFIEPWSQSREAALPKGAVHRGATNIFGTRIGDHWLTAIGEVPPETLRDIAQHTEYVPLSAPR